MAVYTISFKKIFAEKKKPLSGKIDAKTNISITNLEPADDNTVKISFVYQTEYEPEFGTVEISGDVFYSADQKEIKTINEEWEKNKKINDELSVNLLNRIFSKASIEAAILTKEVNLPVPFNLPKFSKKEKD